MQEMRPAAPVIERDGTAVQWAEIRAAWRHQLRQAAEGAAARRHALVASLAFAIPSPDALVAQHAAGQHAAGFFAQPTAQLALVAYGEAATLSVTGSGSPGQLRRAWAKLLHHAVLQRRPGIAATLPVGPIMLGGLAFDPTMPRTALWESFPDGLLSLPQVLLSVQGQAAALTLNAVVRPGEPTATALAALEAAQHWLEQIAVTTLPDLAGTTAWRWRELVSGDDWQDRVARTAATIRAGTYAKVVLARAVEVDLASPSAPVPVLCRLRAAFPAATLFAIPRGDQVFVGATPERLARVAGGAFATMALAGSAPRGATAAEDAAIGAAMQHDPKLCHEHGVVVTMLEAALAPHCADLMVTRPPELVRLANVQHLRTTITGRLNAGESVLDLVTALHPTPAVGGLPRAGALAFLRANEGLDRGWYAGPIGWVAPSGDGEFAVALRSGLLAGTHATLFAGCGIVGASDPAQEYAESQLKLRAMALGLGLEG